MLIKMLFVILFVNVKGLNLDIWTKKRFENVILKKFWRNTGLSPAADQKSRSNFLLSDDEKLNLLYIGALPNKAITTVRVHWLLDLITVSDNAKEKPIFNFTNLDRLIYHFNQSNLNPDFELMGNPSNYFQNFSAQSKHWTDLIRRVVSRYSNLYGSSYLRDWKFELMNEPDLKQYNFLNFTLNEYLDYFRASEMAVPSLAGPAGLFKDNKKAHSLCWGLLDYCNLNPCNLNMITFHRKGGEIGSQVVEKGLKLINTLISDYPNLKGLPFGNDEADIMTGWYKPLEWRADVRYAALVVQIIIGHIEVFMMKRNISFEMLSNDNAFLSFAPHYFTQRTLLARFQINNTSPRHTQFFRKPVYSVMGLLSLTGKNVKDILYRPGQRGFSYLMTSYKLEDIFLGVVTDDRITNETFVENNSTRADINVRMILSNSTFSGICAGYVIDNVRSNPYKVWKDAGNPPFPDPKLRKQMRDAEGFERFLFHKIKPNQSAIKFVMRNVSVPSVLSIHVCFEGIDPPGKVTELRYINVTQKEIILFWKNALINNRLVIHSNKITRCILTYIVEFRKVGSVEFQRINSKDSFFLSYHHDGINNDGSEVGVEGDYKVAAIDYWNRSGPYSDILTVRR